MLFSALQFLIIVLSPLYIVRFTTPIFSLPTTLLEVLIWIYLLVFFFKVAKENFSWEKFSTRFNLIIGIFLLAGIISIFVSPDKWGGFGIFRAYFLEPILFYFSLIYSNNKKTFNLVTYAIITAGIWLSLLGVLQKFTGGFTLAPHELAQGRISAVYNSANSLALFLGPIIFISLGFFLQMKKNIRLTSLGLLLFFSLIIIWTKSRGGLIAEMLSLLVFGYGLCSLKYRKLKKFWVLIPIFLISLILFFFYEMIQIYGGKSNLSVEDNSFGDTLEIRYYLWEGTINLLKNNPVFGAGLNGFKIIYGQFYRLSPLQEQLQYPHNLFLNFWSETGILGLISFLWLHFLIFKNFWKNFFKSKQPIMGLAFICAFCYLLIHGIVDVPYFKNDLSLEFWTLIGLFELWLRGKDQKLQI